MFRDRQEQIEEKLEEVQREREESLRQREQLIQEMEVANQMTQRDLEKAEEQKEALKLDLKGQVGGRMNTWWSDIYIHYPYTEIITRPIVYFFADDGSPGAADVCERESEGGRREGETRRGGV